MAANQNAGQQFIQDTDDVFESVGGRLHTAECGILSPENLPRRRRRRGDGAATAL